MKKKVKTRYNKHKVDGVISLIASLFVLFISLIDPKVSVIFAFAFLVLYSLFKIFMDKR